ncbi:MAG: DUF2442 domain-containing protein [Deltaproteobacteria bacterium]|nr:DUF2442 domain-containing protein [Deltaproteobacteria bacterium]
MFHSIEVTKVIYLEGYTLLLTFSTGEQKVVDLQDRLNGEIFEPLRNLEYFKQVTVDLDLGTICWSNEADFAPDTLYNIGVPPTSKPSPQIVNVIRMYEVLQKDGELVLTGLPYKKGQMVELLVLSDA